jgi:type I restriction enzyme, S subunit
VTLPSLAIQYKIVAILAAYDDLIENNLRRIKILKEMAQNLYREWFVNFRFPGHENTRFVDSPLGQIPEGWEALEFRELFDIKYGKTLPKTKISLQGLYPVYGAGDVIGYFKEMICKNKCVLVTSRGNGSGTVWRTRGPAFITNNSLIIKPKKHLNHWGYTFIELLFKNSNIMEARTGSAQPQVTIENLNYVKGLAPESNCVERFCVITSP